MQIGPTGVSTVNAAKNAAEDLNTEAENATTHHPRTVAEIVQGRTESHGGAIHTLVKVKCLLNFLNLPWHLIEFPFGFLKKLSCYESPSLLSVMSPRSPQRYYPIA